VKVARVALRGTACALDISAMPLAAAATSAINQRVITHSPDLGVTYGAPAYRRLSVLSDAAHSNVAADSRDASVRVSEKERAFPVDSWIYPGR
jgi:hypothetical protein